MFKKWKKIVTDNERYLEAFMKIDIARHDAAKAFAYHLTACKQLLEARNPQPEERGDMGKAVSRTTKIADMLLKLDIKLDDLILIAHCGGIIASSHLPAMNDERQKAIFIKMAEAYIKMQTGEKAQIDI